jgi:hypothetical protein
MKRLMAILSFCLVAVSCQEDHAIASNPDRPEPADRRDAAAIALPT